MLTTLVALLVGCGGSQPASIKLEGEPSVAVHAMDPQAVEAATVLDAAGAALATQPEVVWTVTPDTVAKLDGTNVVPVANGEATVKASVGDISAEYKFVVALPDKLAINGYNAGDAWPMGEAKQLTAQVFAGETAIEGQTATWTSDNAAVATVDEMGKVTAVAEGTANVSAAWSNLTTTVALTVGPAAPATADAGK